MKQGGRWETTVVAFTVLRKGRIWAHLGSRPNRIWCQPGCGKRAKRSSVIPEVCASVALLSLGLYGTRAGRSGGKGEI